MPVETPPAPVAVRRSATLAVLSVAQFLIALDYAIVYIALPSIGSDLHLSPAQVQWVVSAYAVLFAGFLVAGGRLSDRVGAKRLFVWSVVGFGLASAAGGVAGDGSVLLAARGVQGLCAAMLQPAVLGLIANTFPAGPARNRALAVWGSVGASGLAIGTILGGLLTTVSWRLTFWINVPLTLLAALGAIAWFTAPAPERQARRIPVVAAALGTGTVLALALGLTLAADAGWTSTSTLVCLGLVLVLAIAFVRHESGARNVLIDPVLRRTFSLRLGAVATALYMASVGSEFYLLTVLLQNLKGYEPLQAGLAFLPLAVMVTAGNVAADRAVRRHGAAAVLVGGFAVSALGLVWLALALHGDSYVVHLLPGLLLSGFGHGVVYTSMFVIGTHDVPSAHESTAGALLTTSQYLSGALTIAVLTLVLGPAPDETQFRAAFLVTAGAALLGLALVHTRRRML